MKKKTALLILTIYFLSINTYSQTQNHRDSTDVINYSIYLDITNISGHLIKGFTQISLKPLFNNTNHLAFDLLKLPVDSVYVEDQKIPDYSYNDSIVRFNINSIQPTDTIQVSIYYGGHPVVDPSGWGGFYWHENGAFNMGVGMQDNPHVYGRSWFPCIDNFTDRASYDLYITTTSDKMAACGGIMVDTMAIDNEKTQYHWQLNSPIPTYLASVAVDNFTNVASLYEGTLENIPIEIYCRPQQVSQVNGSFANLNEMLKAFEYRFGPYFWEKVGFSIVPFNSGAMEHATNIAIPSYAADGSLQYETLIAHELSHHWFGDLITCSTPEDMWINEGWASYCEAIFTEWLYGKTAFKNYVRSNHSSVLLSAPKRDDGFMAVYGIPHELTYGKTVYDKGADMAHTLRGYLGDSLFFSGMSAFLSENKFNDVSSEEMRDFLSEYTGINCNDFFDGWIFSPGFRQFSVDSFNVNPLNQEFEVDVYVHQRLRQAPEYAKSNRIEVTFMDRNWQQQTKLLSFSGETGHQLFTIPFNPSLAMLDYNEKLADATTDYNKVINSDGNYSFSTTNFNCFVSGLTDSVFIRAEQHFVPADDFEVPSEDKHISKYFYWTIHTIVTDTTQIRGKFNYNFNNSEYYINNQNSFKSGVDSLTFYFRPNATKEWREISHFFSGSYISGYFLTDSLYTGDYAIGVKQGTSLLPQINNKNDKSLLHIFPNPSSEAFEIEFIIADSGKICIYNINGEEVFKQNISGNDKKFTWHPTNIQPGVYHVDLYDKTGRIATKKIIYK